MYRWELGGSSEEQMVFYMDDMSTEGERVRSLDDLRRNWSLRLTSPEDAPHRTVSCQTDKPRRSRNSIDADRLSRRSSVHSNRSRANSYVRPTPLGGKVH